MDSKTSKTPWTPGPWSVGGSIIGRGRGDAGVAIARVLRKPACYGGKRIETLDTSADAPETGAEIDANARLMAAAPELYDKLEAVLDDIAQRMIDGEESERIEIQVEARELLARIGAK